MADTITLKRTFKEEPSPRYYTVSGGEFAAMKDTVAFTGGKFESSPVKAWKVQKPAIDALKESGYTVTVWPFLRMAAFNERTIYDQPGRPATCDVSFEYINTDGRYRALPGSLRVAVGEISAEAVRATNDQINADLVAIGLPPSEHLDRFTAVRKLCRAAAETAAADVVAAFEEASGGKRTADAIKAGFTAIQALLAV
jgi:hypothetical protein